MTGKIVINYDLVEVTDEVLLEQIMRLTCVDDIDESFLNGEPVEEIISKILLRRIIPNCCTCGDTLVPVYTMYSYLKNLGNPDVIDTERYADIVDYLADAIGYTDHGFSVYSAKSSKRGDIFIKIIDHLIKIGYYNTTGE